LDIFATFRRRDGGTVRWHTHCRLLLDPNYDSHGRRSSMAERVLVTGGAGFIGSHLVRRLLNDGAEVRVFDNFETGKRENLDEVARDIEIVEADLRDLDAVRRAVDGCRYVLHQGALGSVPRSVANPLESLAVNATGTLNVLEAARDADVGRVMFASSSSVYGDDVEMPKRETAKPKPLSPYALSKLSAEQACGIFTRLYGLETVALRYFNVFGPRQDPQSQYAAVIPRFVTAMIAGEAPTVYGDGTQSRDFTYIGNVVEANMLAMRAPAERAVGTDGGVYNASCGGRASLLDLVDEINRVLGTSLAPRFEPGRAGDVKHSQAAIDLAAERLGYAPQVGFVEGLERTVEWYVARSRESAATA
jgi:nucleoside-diphosphate-sugar epimerase